MDPLPQVSLRCSFWDASDGRPARPWHPHPRHHPRGHRHRHAPSSALPNDHQHSKSATATFPPVSSGFLLGGGGHFSLQAGCRPVLSFEEVVRMHHDSQALRSHMEEVQRRLRHETLLQPTHPGVDDSLMDLTVCGTSAAYQGGRTGLPDLPHSRNKAGDSPPPPPTRPSIPCPLPRV